MNTSPFPEMRSFKNNDNENGDSVLLSSALPLVLKSQVFFFSFKQKKQTISHQVMMGRRELVCVCAKMMKRIE